MGIFKKMKLSKQYNLSVLDNNIMCACLAQVTYKLYAALMLDRPKLNLNLLSKCYKT